MNLFIFTYICMNLVIKSSSLAENKKTSLPCLKLNRNAKIVGGFEAEKNQLPFIVSLTRRGGHFCGSTILNEKWLITAGHCVCNSFNEILKPSQIKGILGLHKISEFQLNTEFNSINQPFEVEFKSIRIHPEYKCSKTANDIALLELVKPIKFSKHVQSACIDLDAAAENEQNHENAMATVSGWGWTNENQENGIRADVLQSANVKIWSNTDCQQSYEEGGKRNIIDKTQMCAGYKDGGIDSCWADSGGPLVLNNVLVGIVSTGIGCARKNLPGIYTRVNKYTNWIQSTIS